MNKIVGKVEGIYISTVENQFSNLTNEASFSFEGMLGDRHLGLTYYAKTNHPEFKEKIEVKNTRQISIMSVEELALIADELVVSEIKAEWLSTNFLVSGIPHLSQIPAGARFYFSGGLILYNEGENFPCRTAATIVRQQYPHIEGIQQRFIKAAFHKRGLLAWVEHPEKLIMGSDFEVALPTVWENLWN